MPRGQVAPGRTWSFDLPTSPRRYSPAIVSVTRTSTRTTTVTTTTKTTIGTRTTAEAAATTSTVDCGGRVFVDITACHSGVALTFRLRFRLHGRHDLQPPARALHGLALIPAVVAADDSAVTDGDGAMRTENPRCLSMSSAHPSPPDRL
mmetsp:Transcript_24124/g.77664  ORF Transcript_24124/g.77664 Transcript_24124/m.77664 type:complete len:149 (-) Transcript_24124:76-522(-)